MYIASGDQTHEIELSGVDFVPGQLGAERTLSISKTSYNPLLVRVFKEKGRLELN